MRNETTNGSSENIVKLSDIRRERQRASSPFGLLKAGSITWQRTDRDQALTELLNSLESVVADLNSKSYTVLDTLIIAIQEARVALCDTTTEEVGTE